MDWLLELEFESTAHRSRQLDLMLKGSQVDRLINLRSVLTHVGRHYSLVASVYA